jgi:rare lipoprotein A
MVTAKAAAPVALLRIHGGIAPPASCNALVAALVLALTACGSAPKAPAVEREAAAPGRVAARASAPPNASPASRGGAFYKDDGPGDAPPPDLDRIADASPRIEPLHRFANNPYNVFGRDYVPMKSLAPFRQSGIASWYGRKFHGQRTASGEIYDMYGMTAAHPTLPIPSYVRVFNQQNGRSVIVRVNDRGPFHAGRVIDLSFAAAFRLGYAISGSTPVQLELLQAEDIAKLAAQRGAAPNAAPSEPGAVATTAPSGDREPFRAALPSAAAPAAAASGVYLQLGAFSARDNAESFRSRVYREVVWLNDPIEVLQREGIYRLHLGPYRDRSEAAGVAERLKRDIDLNPVYVTR